MAQRVRNGKCSVEVVKVFNTIVSLLQSRKERREDVVQYRRARNSVWT